MDNVTLTLFADVLNEYFSKKDVRPKRKKLLFPEMRVTISGNLHLGGSKFFFFLIDLLEMLSFRLYFLLMFCILVSLSVSLLVF